MRSVALFTRKSEVSPTEGSIRYPNARKLFILADNGGSNGSTHHAWKYALQSKLADPFGLTLTVCHYPPATSKWNPIEHRLFTQISRNWAGEPLSSYETIVSASEVVREALRLLEDRDRLNEIRLTEMRDAIRAGNEELARGERVPGKQVFDELRTRSRQRRAKG